jgi:glycosyltransferase involved in cell wall biosynthesis
MTTPLTVVMPVLDEAPHLPDTLAALVEAVGRSDFEADLVLVDDGSTDGSSEVAQRAVDGRMPLTVIEQPNRGRFAARRAGLEAATGEYVLFLDSRVRLEPSALAFVRGRLAEGERVWNGHVHIDAEGNPFGSFWKVLTEIAWRGYFADPRTTSFGAEHFDRYPKGTTCFLAPRVLLLAAVERFRSYYRNGRFVSDDTALIRALAQHDRIHLSPSFACAYTPRGNLGSFVRQAFYRGSTFVDGHGRPESRFFPVVLAFYPLSVAAAVTSLRRPTIVPVLALGAAVAAAAVAVAARRSPFETLSFAGLVPVYSVAHGAGMWRGLALAVQSRLVGATRE